MHAKNAVWGRAFETRTRAGPQQDPRGSDHWRQGPEQDPRGPEYCKQAAESTRMFETLSLQSRGWLRWRSDYSRMGKIKHGQQRMDKHAIQNCLE